MIKCEIVFEMLATMLSGIDIFFQLLVYGAVSVVPGWVKEPKFKVEFIFSS